MKILITFYSHFLSNILYRNSVYMMISSVFLSGFGFLFWFINAKFFDPEQVGMATAFISLVSLIASFSIFGIGNALVRYLPTSTRANETLSTALILVGGASFLLFLVYAFGVSLFTPRLAVVVHSPLFFVILGIFVFVSSLNLLFDSIFVAFRSAQFLLIKDIVISILKLFFSILFLSLGGMGIVAAVTIATCIAIVISLVILYRRFCFHLIPRVDWGILRSVWRYSFGNYVSNFVVTLPSFVLPLFVLNKLGAGMVAYYYIAYMIANLLFTIPFSVGQSLVAEGSYDGAQKGIHIRKSIKAIFSLLIPGVAVVYFFGGTILAAFGKSYSSGGLLFLQMLAFSSIFVAINSVFVAVFRIEERVRALVAYSVVVSFATIILSILLVSYQLAGIGVAFLLGSAIATLFNVIMVVPVQRFVRVGSHKA